MKSNKPVLVEGCELPIAEGSQEMWPLSSSSTLQSNSQDQVNSPENAKKSETIHAATTTTEQLLASDNLSDISSGEFEAEEYFVEFSSAAEDLASLNTTNPFKGNIVECDILNIVVSWRYTRKTTKSLYTRKFQKRSLDSRVRLG